MNDADASRGRLAASISTRIRTAMIGGLSATEGAFGHLWGRGKDARDLTPGEEEWLGAWLELRTRILNLGNGQIRAATAEIGKHTVIRERHQTDPGADAGRGGGDAR